MDLWIKNQKGRLSKIVDIMEPIFDEWGDVEGYCLYGYSSCQSFVHLDIYKTKERALEVLNEIQEILKPKVKVISHIVEEKQLNNFSREIIMEPIIEDVQIQESSTYVYEMPEE